MKIALFRIIEFGRDVLGFLTMHILTLLNRPVDYFLVREGQFGNNILAILHF